MTLPGGRSILWGRNKIIFALLVLSLLIIVNSVLAASAWIYIGDPGFSAGYTEYTSLALDGSTPYVAYTDSASTDHATVMRFNGSSWETVGDAGFSPGYAYYISLALDGNTPYVAFRDAANSYKATVMRFNGSSWETVGDAGFSEDYAYDTSLALDGSTPYVAFRDGNHLNKATVMRFNGSSWVAVGGAGFSDGPANYISLALDGSTPYVAFRDGANSDKATVMRFNGSSWETVGGAGFSAGSANYTSLVLDGSTPYLAFQDGANSDKATVMRFNGSSWETVVGAGFSAGYTEYTSLALAGSTPYVAFQDGANGYKTSVMSLHDDPDPVVSQSSPSNGASIQPVSRLSVSFNKEMKHDGSAGAANNTANYLLLEAGGDGFQTLTCLAGAHADDQVIPINSAVYSSNPGGPYQVSLTVNGGQTLPAGSYRLLVCGTTSVEDLAGNKINQGLNDSVIDFTIVGVSEAPITLPETGFAPNQVTSLPSRPMDSTYTNLAETLWLEIPTLRVKEPIVGVPATSNGWDVSWLGNDIGWLEGTAFPTWNGNAILTGHLYNYDGLPGVFIDLHTIKWGDEVIIRMAGQRYIFEVRDVRQYVDVNAINEISMHQEHPWLTLMTCQGYDDESGSYNWRMYAKAVLIDVQ